MLVRDIMTQQPITAAPEQTVADALDIMHSGSFHHLPVVSERRHLIGIVSDRDCRMALDSPDTKSISTQQHKLARSIRLRDVMTAAPITTDPGQDIFEAGMIMYEHHINCLPVMLEETLVGILTSSDLLIACIQLTRRTPTTPLDVYG
jgi:acetoin utilization protein AcuB